MFSTPHICFPLFSVLSYVSNHSSHNQPWTGLVNAATYFPVSYRFWPSLWLQISEQVFIGKYIAETLTSDLNDYSLISFSRIRCIYYHVLLLFSVQNTT